MIKSAFLFLAVSFIFALFDATFYPKTQRGELNLVLYRALQLVMQFASYLLLIALSEWGALAGFIAAHNLMGLDWFYYVLRHEDFTGYDPIDWFKVSLVQIVSHAFRGHWINGKELRYIGPAACALGLIIAIVFA